MTRNAVCLTHKGVKPQSFSVRKGSCTCGPEAITVFQWYYTRRPLLFSVYMDVTRSRSVISLDKLGILFLCADILIFNLLSCIGPASEAVMYV